MVASHVRLLSTLRLCLIALAAFEWLACVVPVYADSAAQPQDIVLRGKVQPLGEVLKRVTQDLKADPEPISHTVVLVCDDKSVVPLISDEASRALFKDTRLQNRPVEIHARKWSGLPYVQVITLKVDQDGKLRTPEYFCQVCTISLRYPQTCPCCQGPMEFRMKPEAP